MLRSALLEAPHGFSMIADGDLRPGAAGAVSAGQRLVDGLGGAGPLCLVHQVHGPRVVHGDVAQTAALTGTVEAADALWSDRAGQVLSIRVADCVPILLEGDREGAGRVVAAVHAGWRGTALDIVRETVGVIRQVYPSGVRRAAVGPAICGRCYEVGAEVLTGVSRVAPGRAWRSGNQVDLALANTLILESLGIEVDWLRRCTRCDPGFWSYRRDGEAGGRQAALIRA